MSVVRQICLKHTYQHTFMFDFKYWYVWNSTIYVWSQTLMSEARQICLGHACMYEVYSHICLKTTHFCMKPYIYVWSRYIEVSDAGWQLISFFWAIKCYFPPGRWSIGALELQKQYPVGLVSTTLAGSVELLYRLSWWPGDGAHGIYSSPIDLFRNSISSSTEFHVPRRMLGFQLSPRCRDETLVKIDQLWWPIHHCSTARSHRAYIGDAVGTLKRSCPIHGA